MPYLLDVQLQDNPLTSLTIDKCPSIDYINLDACFIPSTNLDSFVLPSATNRVMRAGDLPDSISEAVIPNPSTALNRFSFRRNSVSETGYDTFVQKMAETIAITRFTDLNDTVFGAVGSFTNRGNNPVYCETIDLSNVVDASGGSARRILEYIFGGITEIDMIKHDKQIRIILTGINTDVDYTTDLNVSTQVLNRMSFIN